MRSKILIALSFMLAACSPGGESKTDAPPAAPTSFEIQLGGSNQFAVPAGAPIVITPVQGAVQLSGHVQFQGTEAPLQTQGASIRLGPEYEQLFAGHRVRVSLRVRSLDGATTFQSAYSTNDVGNSQWRDLPLTASFREASYEYNVAPINRGADDFIGINPPANGTMEISTIRVERVDALRQ